jgi:hypothetical protein
LVLLALKKLVVGTTKLNNEQNLIIGKETSVKSVTKMFGVKLR